MSVSSIAKVAIADVAVGSAISSCGTLVRCRRHTCKRKRFVRDQSSERLLFQHSSSNLTDIVREAPIKES
jgi:hypothetical protein